MILVCFRQEHDWTNDGKIIYSTNEGGNADIWTINEEGGEKRQLTADASAEISPKMSKDGSFLIFLSNRSGKINVWRTNANGTNPMQITNQENVKENNNFSRRKIHFLSCSGFGSYAGNSLEGFN
ncbi:MAG: hypothetical protein HC846_04665 [Blastocatellia bacterium]|nr:hypothetical protein [Blastocatellia bacterium]